MIINLLITCETFVLIFSRNLDRDTFSLVGPLPNHHSYSRHPQLFLPREQQVVGRRELAAAGGAERRN